MYTNVRRKDVDCGGCLLQEPQPAPLLLPLCNGAEEENKMEQVKILR